MRSLFIAVFLSFHIYSPAQNKSAKLQSISFEIGKTGAILNLIYDQKFSKFGFRVGAGSNLNKYLRAITFGGGGFYLLGKKNSFFEFGTELNYLAVEEFSNDQKSFIWMWPGYDTKTFLANINLGYRMYSSKTLIRIGVSPCITKDQFIPGGYISIGLIL